MIKPATGPVCFSVRVGFGDFVRPFVHALCTGGALACYLALCRDVWRSGVNFGALLSALAPQRGLSLLLVNSCGQSWSLVRRAFIFMLHKRGQHCSINMGMAEKCRGLDFLKNPSKSGGAQKNCIAQGFPAFCRRNADEIAHGIAVSRSCRRHPQSDWTTQGCGCRWGELAQH